MYNLFILVFFSTVLLGRIILAELKSCRNKAVALALA
jgi:hypothetical protein